ncbi:MAG: VWA domain-containing protein, partial [Gammaproteobacteria bacterium]
MSIRFDHPEYLWLLLLAVPIAWLGMHSLVVLEPARRWTIIGLRLALLLLLVLMLAGLQAVRTHDDLTVIAVVDQSESVRRFARPPKTPDQQESLSEVEFPLWVRTFLEQRAQDRRDGDRLGLVTYDGQPRVKALPHPATNLDSDTIDRPVEGTNTAEAIRSAMALFPPDSGHRLVLVTDGNDTTGDVIAAAHEAAATGIPIDVVPVRYRVEQEVMVERLYAPNEAREGQTVTLRVVLRATRPTEGQMLLLHDENPIDLNGQTPGQGAPIQIEDWTLEEADDHPSTTEVNTFEEDTDADNTNSALGRYVAVREVDVPLAYTGVNRFRAIFEPAKGQDTMAVNNQAEAFTLVAGKGRILFVDN